MGFNVVRIPWSNEMLDKSPTSIQISEYSVDSYTGEMGMNVELKMNPLKYWIKL